MRRLPILLALGLGALACSGQTPSSPDPAATAGPLADVTLNAPSVTSSCYYGTSAPYNVTVSWTALSVYTVEIYSGGTSLTDTLRHPTRTADFNFSSVNFAPAHASLRNRKGVQVANPTCTQLLPQP